jgi:hypothetical protein
MLLCLKSAFLNNQSDSPMVSLPKTAIPLCVCLLLTGIRVPCTCMVSDTAIGDTYACMHASARLAPGRVETEPEMPCVSISETNRTAAAMPLLKGKPSSVEAGGDRPFSVPLHNCIASTRPPAYAEAVVSSCFGNPYFN